MTNESQSGRIDPDIVLGRPYRTLNKYNIRCDEDKEACRIRGCLILPDDNILLSDRENNSLKLFNKSWQIQSYIKLQDMPWDMCSVSAKQVIVSLPHAKKLQFVETEEKLKLGHQISVDKKCYGVDHHRDKLYVSCTMKIIRERSRFSVRRGNVSHVLEVPVRHTSYSVPSILPLIQKEESSSLMTRTNKLTCMKETGELVYSYSDTDMKAPLGLLLDRKDNVYICGYRFPHSPGDQRSRTEDKELAG